ncbi:HlyD family secretion protein [Salinihabitans flavidus]|uniref:HlyD family secretion protein n=1 Tax=Salinihabitans flavidus TaxID=569882 RepID=A0A1H8P2P7_9RHOB|nr:HlyD family efflux transporter periplasmic adaptor subunit [Salinihabitans flavidus]SEO36200.1 HlyD family secretion protein [Salinihabitans flavidus]
MAKRQSRRILILAATMLVAAGLVAAFWPQPQMVDTGTVRRGDMTVTVDEEARTRVREAYVVSTPIAGRLLRVALEPGAYVEEGKTVVARMLPTNPAALDIRTREQARAAISAAEAALRVAQADLHRAMADRDLARTELERSRKLHASGNIAQMALDRAESRLRSAEASVDTARAAISMRVADLENAQARLIGFDDPGLYAAISGNGAIDLPAPKTGRVLRVIQQSETTLPAGAPILEIGDIEGDLEVVVELLSADAVQVRMGDPVLITNYGGPEPLHGEVARIDPWGFTKYSALGVEEQRVNAVIRFTDPPEARAALGHGFRVEVRIVVWQARETLIVPSSALFRDDGDWAVFVAEGGRAVKRAVTPGRNNGIDAQVLGGLENGARVVLYPSSALSDGIRIAERGAS